MMEEKKSQNTVQVNIIIEACSQSHLQAYDSIADRKEQMSESLMRQMDSSTALQTLIDVDILHRCVLNLA